MERNDHLLKRKFYKYLIPGIMMVAAMQLGDLVDSIFIGNILGSQALSASTIAMPVVLLWQVPIMLLAVGGATVAAIYLGKNRQTTASLTFTASFLLQLILCIACCALSLFYAYRLSALLCGPDASADMVKMTGDFMITYLLGMPFIGLGIATAYFMGVDNHPVQSAMLHIVANVINLITDIVFLAILHTGIIGSALSTVIGYGAAGIIFLIYYIFSKKRMLQFCLPPAGEKGQMASLLAESVKTGLPSGVMFILNAAKILILNAAILAMIGEEGMAIYAICVNSMFIVQLCLLGIVGVIQTIVGVLYGEKDYYGIRKILGRTVKLCLFVSLLLMAVFLIFPDIIAAMFGFDLPALAGEMNACLRVYGLSFVFYGLNNIAQTYYGTIQKSFLATLNTLLQGIIILIPVTLGCMAFTGVIGSCIAAVITETAAFLITWYIRVYQEKRGIIEGVGFAAIPLQAEGQYVDLTVQGTTVHAAGLAHTLVAYCEKNAIPRRLANKLALAGEELVYNISRYGGKNANRSYIDICLCRVEDSLVLRVRDDGAPFNPLAYLEEQKAVGQEAEQETSDALESSGIAMIKSIAGKLQYVRILNMNNTIVEIHL